MKQKYFFITISLAILLIGCILAAGCISPDTPINSSENVSSDKVLTPLELEDPETAILGNWRYEFTNPNGGSSSLTYSINPDNTGVLTTKSGSATAQSDLHWFYDEDNMSYMINYDTLNQQEYMVLYTDEDGNRYLVSLGGGYICKKF
ncbi:MAG TPA: hypothetical protein O0X27_03035 [Methanocorpusculum sp.]|nr:hypothetical protein [Methanocorpusculum sp.]